MRIGTVQASIYILQSGTLDAAGSDILRLGCVGGYSTTSGRVIPIASAAAVWGVAVRGVSGNTIDVGETKPEYGPGDGVPILVRGVVQAYVEEAVNAGDALTVRISGENNTTTFRGNFAKTIDGARVVVAGLRALDTIATPGLVRVSVNLPQ